MCSKTGNERKLSYSKPYHVVHISHPPSSCQQCFGRNASSVHTSSSNVATSQHAGFETLGFSMQCCSMPTDAASDDDDIVVKVPTHFQRSHSRLHDASSSQESISDAHAKSQH